MCKIVHVCRPANASPPRVKDSGDGPVSSQSNPPVFSGDDVPCPYIVPVPVLALDSPPHALSESPTTRAPQIVKDPVDLSMGGTIAVHLAAYWSTGYASRVAGQIEVTEKDVKTREGGSSKWKDGGVEGEGSRDMCCVVVCVPCLTEPLYL